MEEKAIHLDVQPIRAACFSPSGDYFALGTNSKSLKICSLPKINSDDEDDEENPSSDFVSGRGRGKGSNEINVILEQQNHHNGSIYCIDWSRTGKLVATGSNDKAIKLLVCPNFEEDELVSTRK